jgi:hypothetical protein
MNWRKVFPFAFAFQAILSWNVTYAVEFLLSLVFGAILWTSFVMLIFHLLRGKERASSKNQAKTNIGLAVTMLFAGISMWGLMNMLQQDSMPSPRIVQNYFTGECSIKVYSHSCDGGAPCAPPPWWYRKGDCTDLQSKEELQWIIRKVGFCDPEPKLCADGSMIYRIDPGCEYEQCLVEESAELMN